MAIHFYSYWYLFSSNPVLILIAIPWKNISHHSILQCCGTIYKRVCKMRMNACKQPWHAKKTIKRQNKHFKICKFTSPQCHSLCGSWWKTWILGFILASLTVQNFLFVTTNTAHSQPDFSCWPGYYSIEAEHSQICKLLIITVFWTEFPVRWAAL